MLSGALDKDNTEVGIQYRTDFASSFYARAIESAFTEALSFLDTTATASTSLYDGYFGHMTGSTEASALESWRLQFKGLDAGCHFPPLPYPSHTARANSTASHDIHKLTWLSKYNVKTLILGSWALLQASYEASADVVVGVSTWAAEYGTERHSAPLPIRLKIDLTQDVGSYLEHVQVVATEFANLPGLPLNRLSRLGGESTLACNFQTTLAIGTGCAGAEAERGRALAAYFEVKDDSLQIKVSFDDYVISTEQINRLLTQFETVLCQLGSSLNSCKTLANIDTISNQDLQMIASWNGAPYEVIQELVHDVFSRTAQTFPDSVAVSSWDGELSYRQLDELSTRLAHRLALLNLAPEEAVPMFFEKSLWVPVSVIAVMKAGAAGVLIDSTQPVERARSIMSQVNAKHVLVSRGNAEKASQFEGLPTIIIDKAAIDALPEPEPGFALPRLVQPSNIVYISFTSGSTGRPKGAMITHSCFTSCIKHQQRALGFGPDSRTYDFASYAFDAAWSNLLHTLTSGACLCIPSEYQRKNMLLESIRDSRATLLNATPTVLRHLDPRELPDLERILMGGEAWAEEDFVDWIDNKQLINSYGPGEGTIKACLIQAFRGMVPNTIGTGKGVTTWIVRADGSDKLAPLGAVGEIWLEGPQVARGYIADEAKTAASFVDRPRWTDKGEATSHFYRTGDLGRYAPDGALIFVSRADSQVKIRGQRTELGEVEHNIKKALAEVDFHAQIVAEVLTPRESNNPILIAFIKAEDRDEWHKLRDIDERLANMVPDYRIPTT